MLHHEGESIDTIHVLGFPCTFARWSCLSCWVASPYSSLDHLFRPPPTRQSQSSSSPSAQKKSRARGLSAPKTAARTPLTQAQACGTQTAQTQAIHISHTKRLNTTQQDIRGHGKTSHLHLARKTTEHNMARHQRTCMEKTHVPAEKPMLASLFPLSSQDPAYVRATADMPCLLACLLACSKPAQSKNKKSLFQSNASVDSIEPAIMSNNHIISS